MEEPVVYTRNGKVGIISINNGKNNPLNLQVLESLSKKLKESSNKDHGVIIRSEGKNFTVGVDIKYIYKTIIEDNNHEEFAKLSDAFQEITRSILDHSGLVVVSLKGWVIGGGFELSLAADLRVCATNTRIMLPELKIGTMFSNGATQLLPELIGTSRAKQLMFLGEEISAEKALEFGLVNKIYEEKELDEKLLDLVNEFVDKTHHLSVMETKKLIERNRIVSIHETLNNELEVLNKFGYDKVFLENIRNFVEK